MSLKQPVPVPLIAVAVVAVLAIAGFLGFRQMAPPAPLVTNSVDTRKSIEQLAMQSGGDYSKLTADEQKLLDMTYRGNGRRAIHNIYKSLTAPGGH